MTLSPKIEARHQRLQAIIYIRQSTPRQVQIVNRIESGPPASGQS